MRELLAKPSALAVTIGSILVRLLPHPPNMTPLGATALFGGAKLKRPWNYLAPLFVLFVTDLILGFHALMPFVYACFALSVFLAERLLTHSPSIKKIVGLALLNSLIFFVVTNFGVWLEGRLYPLTGSGLIQTYLMGLPFWRNMLVGDVIFSLGVFGLYAWAQKQSQWQKVDRQLASWLLKS